MNPPAGKWQNDFSHGTYRVNTSVVELRHRLTLYGPIKILLDTLPCSNALVRELWWVLQNVKKDPPHLMHRVVGAAQISESHL